jgi:hypothetical protein
VSHPPRFPHGVRRRAARALITASVVGATALAVGALASCGDDDPPTAADVRVHRGADVPFGNGSARTEVAVRGATVVSVAVVLSQTALDGLPAQLPPMQSLEFVLPLPAGAPATVFDHVGVNWQPTGHPPMPTYVTPHFDVHFYTITSQQRDAIGPGDPQFAAKTARQPAPEERPAGYTLDVAAIPRMGVHAGAADTPESRGLPFTTTFVYGFWDGGMIFLEPMLTRAFLLTRPDTVMKIATPARYARSGAYPTAYAVRYDAEGREYRMELRDFVGRQ